MTMSTFAKAMAAQDCPRKRPFDAILVAAGTPVVPESLKQQLKVGGRLVIPVGDERLQELQVIVREDEDRFTECSIGKVRFVPLVGRGAWPGPAAQADASPATLPAMIAREAVHLPDPDDPDFAASFERYADRRIVLLGESSHGTREFYRARAAFTRRLVEKHGFTIVAVEADWPDAAVSRPLHPRSSVAGRSLHPVRAFSPLDVAQSCRSPSCRAGCAITTGAPMRTRRSASSGSTSTT